MEVKWEGVSIISLYSCHRAHHQFILVSIESSSVYTRVGELIHQFILVSIELRQQFLLVSIESV